MSSDQDKGYSYPGSVPYVRRSDGGSVGGDLDRQQAIDELDELLDWYVAGSSTVQSFRNQLIEHVETVVKAAGGEARTEQGVMAGRIEVKRHYHRPEAVTHERTVYVMPWREMEREYPDVSGGGVPYPPREVATDEQR